MRGVQSNYRVLIGWCQANGRGAYVPFSLLIPDSFFWAAPVNGSMLCREFEMRLTTDTLFSRCKMLRVIPVSFKVEPDQKVTVVLRKGRTVLEKEGEAIVDVNHDGRWIHGLELLGSVNFNLARAVRPFQPKPSNAVPIGVHV